MNRATRLLAAALLLPLLVAGCGAMPTSGEPHAFDLAAPDTDPVEQLGFGPQLDASPERIISDFLRASAAGASDDYATAKLYLMEGEAAVWNPRSSVIVYPTDQEPLLSVEEISGTKAIVRLTTPVSASVAEDGVLSAQNGALVEVSFYLETRADGQWRIEQLDNGIILSQANFQAAFQAVQLYFLASDQTTLVPDPRWYPRRRLASYLVTGLLAGPSEQLAPAVFSSLTGALTLPTQGVEIVGQTIQVSMEGELPNSEQTQENISRQLSATLLQLTNVTAVEAEINSFPLPTAEDIAGEKLDWDSSVGLVGENLVISAGNTWEPFLSITKPEGPAHDPARSPEDNPTVAWLEGESTLAVWGGADVIRSEVPGAVAPSVDRWGWAWTVTNDESLVAFDALGNRVDLELRGAPKGKIQRVAASPDGVRLLVLHSSDDVTQAHTITVTRDVTGTPRQLTALTQVGMLGSEVVDGSWAGPSHMVFLMASGTDRVVTIVSVGGFAQTLGAPADTVRISGGAQSNQILLATQDGGYYARSGGVWRMVETDVEYLSYAG